jgi:phosphoethanolamine N-methyltransferase
MKAYWAEHSSKKLSNSLMLLMNEDEEFASAEALEIVSYLPQFSGQRVVELGCGIGRFTAYLAQKCSYLLAVDFVERFILENKQQNSASYPHIDFLCKDVTKLNLDPRSFEFVFSNWLFMYLDDAEVERVAHKFYEWCAIDGYIFFRESCEGGASGDLPRTNNPTFYRSYRSYLRIFDSIGGLQLISINQVKIYLDEKNKTNQYCFLYKKIK